MFKLLSPPDLFLLWACVAKDFVLFSLVLPLDLTCHLKFSARQFLQHLSLFIFRGFSPKCGGVPLTPFWCCLVGVAPPSPVLNISCSCRTQSVGHREVQTLQLHVNFPDSLLLPFSPPCLHPPCINSPDKKGNPDLCFSKNFLLFLGCRGDFLLLPKGLDSLLLFGQFCPFPKLNKRLVLTR